MSDTKEKGLLIGPSDVSFMEEFCEYFEVDMSEGMKKALTKFRDNPSIDSQKRFHFELSKMISEMADNKDAPTIMPLIESGQKEFYNLQFDKDFEDIIGDED